MPVKCERGQRCHRVRDERIEFAANCYRPNGGGADANDAMGAVVLGIVIVTVGQVSRPGRLALFERPFPLVIQSGSVGIEYRNVFGRECTADELHQLLPGRSVQIEQ